MAVDVSRARSCSSTNLAAIHHSGNYEVDGLLRDVARQLKINGLRVGGVVRSNGPQAGAHRCDMVLEELTTGETISIFQQLGSGSKGCRLDSAALEHIVGLVDASLERGLDVLIINKFGKREADGRGFSATIAQAVSADIPVLVTVNKDYASAWHRFCAGEGETLAAEQAYVMQWLRDCVPAERVS